MAPQGQSAGRGDCWEIGEFGPSGQSGQSARTRGNWGIGGVDVEGFIGYVSFAPARFPRPRWFRRARVGGWINKHDGRRTKYQLRNERFLMSVYHQPRFPLRKRMGVFTMMTTHVHLARPGTGRWQRRDTCFTSATKTNHRRRPRSYRSDLI